MGKPPLSNKLKLRLTSSEKRRLAKRHTGSTEAYRRYLKGRFHWNKRTEEGLRKAMEFFEQAIQTDGRYALPFSGIADSYHILAYSPRMRPTLWSQTSKTTWIACWP